jgi:hypothetical protein
MFSFNQRSFHAELASPDRRNVSTGSTTYDNDIKFSVGH